jgi:hypothetical protein
MLLMPHICRALDKLDAADPPLQRPELMRRYNELASDKNFARIAFGKTYECSFEDYFQDRVFVDPLDPAQDENAVPLCPKGSQKAVTVFNVREWVALAKKFFLLDGVVAQAVAFRKGVDDFFPSRYVLLLPQRSYSTMSVALVTMWKSGTRVLSARSSNWMVARETRRPWLRKLPRAEKARCPESSFRTFFADDFIPGKGAAGGNPKTTKAVLEFCDKRANRYSRKNRSGPYCFSDWRLYAYARSWLFASCQHLLPKTILAQIRGLRFVCESALGCGA